jgi:hypothetical protein
VEAVNTTDDFYTTYGAEYKFTHLPPEEQSEFLRFVLIHAASPGQTGLAATGASPADPLFWTWHAIFDKALHQLLLNEHYTVYDCQKTYEQLFCICKCAHRVTS